ETLNHIKAFFQDKKHTRAIYLENQFNSINISNFLEISSYCQRLKSLKDQLTNVDQNVSEHKMVL
ncbi:Squalene epoxidase 3, partial [Bienertia sinuspersici]